MNKFNKGKTLGIVAASLASVALVGVGFSTWIIQSTQDKTTSNGVSVTVGETQNQSVKITEANVKEGALNFDADKAKHDNVIKNKGTPLLTCNSGDTEDLSFTLSYTISTENVSNWTINAAIVDASADKFSDADSNRYIRLPSTLGLNEASAKECLNQNSKTGNGLTVTKTTNPNQIVVEQTFTFSWGEAFAFKNPVEVVATDTIYYNKAESVDVTVKNLTDNTKALKDLGLSMFKVKLSVGTIS